MIGEVQQIGAIHGLSKKDIKEALENGDAIPRNQ